MNDESFEAPQSLSFHLDFHKNSDPSEFYFVESISSINGEDLTARRSPSCCSPSPFLAPSSQSPNYLETGTEHLALPAKSINTC